MSVESVRFRELWESYGYPWGATSHTKSIPALVWSSDLACRKAFVLGLLDADGTVGDCVTAEPNLHMCNRDLLHEVKILLRTCGIESRLTKTGNGHRLTLNGWQAYDHLGYGIQRTCRRSNMLAPEFACREFTKLVPRESLLTKADRRVVWYKMNRGGRVGVHTLLRMYRDAGVTPPPLYATVPLLCTEDLPYEEETYTLALSHPLHRFDSEGVISKNTAADVMDLGMFRYWQSLKEAGRYLNGVWPVLQIHDALFAEVREEWAEEERRRLEECLSCELDLRNPVSGRSVRIKLPAEAVIGPNVKAVK